MAVIENRFLCDLSKPVQAQALKGNVFSLDNLGSRLSVLIYDNGQPATISGSITANCILPDGSTVNVNGGLTTENGGSKAYVDVPQSCLLIPGILKIAIKCTSSSVITTLAAIVANVYMTKTDNVITPSQQIITDWNAEISASLANQDAKISDLKSALTATEFHAKDIENKAIKVIYPTNRFNKNTVVNGKIISKKGVISDASGYFYSDLIPVEYGQTYCFYLQTSQFGVNIGANGYGADGERLTYFEADSSTSTAVVITITDPFVRYVRINGKSTNIDVKQFCVGSTLPTYTAYSAPIYYVGDLLNSNAHILDDIDTAKAFIIGNVHYPTNRFNKNTATEGAYIHPGTGVIYEASGYFYSALIPIEYNKTYIFDIVTSEFGANAKNVAIYDKDGNHLGKIEGSNPDTSSCTFTNNVLNAKYVRINGRTSVIGSVRFAEGSTLPAYTAYQDPYYILQNYIRLPENEQYTNPLYGKKISLTGDSICHGAGYLGGFGKIIADENEMTMQNIAVNGATIISGTQASGTDRFWICNSITSMDADSDYAIVEGGVNDASLGVTMGTITSADDFDGPFDTTTFCGAFEKICHDLIYRFAGKKYGYVAVHACAWNYWAYRNNDNSYYYMAKKICMKWGVPFCDLNEKVPAFAYLPADDNLRVTYTDNGDGWHPNEAGYRKYYVDKITDWLKGL